MELRDQVEIWRAKAREGTLTEEEMREAITVLRAGRMAAAAKPVGAAKAPPPTLSFEDI